MLSFVPVILENPVEQSPAFCSLDYVHRACSCSQTQFSDAVFPFYSSCFSHNSRADMGLFCKMLKCSPGIDFLIRCLPPLPPLPLLQIDMSHCCRLTLSLESITVSYFRAVFSLFLMESGLGHVWRRRGRERAQREREEATLTADCEGARCILMFPVLQLQRQLCECSSEKCGDAEKSAGMGGRWHSFLLFHQCKQVCLREMGSDAPLHYLQA